MKQGTLINRLIALLLLGAVIIYLAVSAWQSFQNPFSTVISFSYSVDDTVACTGYLVREETVLTGSGGIVDLLPGEGEKVARGETVALLYRSEAGLDRRQALQALSLEREQLQYALQNLDGNRDTAQLSQAVIDAIINLRACVSTGNLSGLEERTMALRSLIYRRELTYESSDAAAALAASIQAVDQQISGLRALSAQDTVPILAHTAGIFSGQVDGYEDLLTPDLLDTMSLADLRQLSLRRIEPPSGAVGKLITSARWCLACPLSEADAARLEVGRTVQVRFSLDWSGDIDMLVERIGDPENGQVLVVCSTDRYLFETTLLRRQAVELVFGTQTGIRVPKSAIRVVARTRTDPESGQTVEENVTGVYALVGKQAEFKPVQVLVQQDDYCLVEGIPPERSSEGRKILRAGDEIIVAAVDLFDGKVVR